MAIKQKDLLNRLNDPKTKICIAFEYHLLAEDDMGKQFTIPVYYNRLSEKTWDITMVVRKETIGLVKAYTNTYIIPSANIDLPVVAAIGLNNLRWIIAEEINFKSMLDFKIGDVIANML